MTSKTKKNKTLKNILTITISLVIAVFFMNLAFKGTDFKSIKEAFLRANYWWILAAAFFGLLAYVFRAIRWNLLLEPLGYRITNQNALWSISFGYLMNLTVPRSGELARATALYGVEKVPVNQSFGTIILERIVDLLCMFLFLGLTLILKYDAILAFYQQSNVKINSVTIIGVISVLILGIFLFFRFKDYFSQFAILKKIIDFIDGIFSGITSIFKLKQNGKFILLSLLIWISYYFAAYLVCFALPETSSFSFADGFFIIVAGTLGMIVPASGGAGSFHFALKLGIGALFLSMGKSFDEGAEIGLAYAFLSHTMQLVIMIIMGLISIPILVRERNKKAD
ncbi:MAG: TIGR00374 family protein [Flavobacteriales bacterium]|nr:MAG: TIGR00374 family protein [Flavobacteriales bacterium]